MEKDWVQIYSTDKMFQAEIFKQVLADHKIEAVIIIDYRYPLPCSYRTCPDPASLPVPRYILTGLFCRLA